MNQLLSNFAAELVRKNLEPKDIASTINRDERTVKNKIKGVTPLLYSEAVLIHNTHFPELDLDYLFEQAQEG